MSAIGAWKLKLEAGGFLPVAGSTDGASPIKHTTDILSRDRYVYKVTCLVSYITHMTGHLGSKRSQRLMKFIFWNDKISMKNIISGKMILAVWKEVFQESILEMKIVFFKSNMSRTIDVLSEPDSNSDHRNNVFAENFEPMTHPRTGGCYIPGNHQSDIKIMLKSYSMNQNHILVIWTWSPIVWTLMTSCIKFCSSKTSWSSASEEPYPEEPVYL